MPMYGLAGEAVEAGVLVAAVARTGSDAGQIDVGLRMGAEVERLAAHDGRLRESNDSGKRHGADDARPGQTRSEKINDFNE